MIALCIKHILAITIVQHGGLGLACDVCNYPAKAVIRAVGLGDPVWIRRGLPLAPVNSACYGGQ